MLKNKQRVNFLYDTELQILFASDNQTFRT